MIVVNCDTCRNNDVGLLGIIIVRRCLKYRVRSLTQMVFKAGTKNTAIKKDRQKVSKACDNCKARKYKVS